VRLLYSVTIGILLGQDQSPGAFGSSRECSPPTLTRRDLARYSNDVPSNSFGTSRVSCFSMVIFPGHPPGLTYHEAVATDDIQVRICTKKLARHRHHSLLDIRSRKITTRSVSAAS
jgi:hypothetical protein